jgi:ATP-dependent protease ClpP protease subunit
MNQPIDLALLESPTISLSGTVDHAMYIYFKNNLAMIPQAGPSVIELSTLGGDPEIARMMGEDVRFHSSLYPERRIMFVGKTAVYSAGVTFMSFFAPENRFLTRGTRLMIHERIISRDIRLSGPLTTCIATLKAALNEIETSIVIQNEGFANLLSGSSVSVDELIGRAAENWYVEAQDAKTLGLIADII